MKEKKYYAHTKKDRPESEWQELKKHLIGTAEIASGFTEDSIYEKLFYYAGLIHDIGKYQANFQKYLKEGGRRGSVPHAFFGAGYSKILGFNEISFAIDGHHKGLPERSEWKDDISKYSESKENEMLTNTFLEDLTLNIKEIKAYVPAFNNQFERELFTRFLFSSLTDADWLDTEKALTPDLTEKRTKKVFNADELIAKIENEINSKPKEGELNKLRNDVREEAIRKSDSTPGFYSLNLPTGMGKTLTSVLWALKHAKKNDLQRIIIVLPYINIIDQTARILKRVFSNDMVLEHHSGNNEAIDTSEAGEDYLHEQKLACENWDFPLIITTTVQFFESIFSNRPSRCRKVHNIYKAVVIFDEVQTLPKELIIPTLTILKNINSIMRTSFLFCTATLPAFEKRDRFEGIENIQPLIANPDLVFKKTKRVTYNILNDSREIENSDLVLEAAIQNCAVLCIFNTKRAALEFFKEANKDKIWQKYYHLSTAMCPDHRKEAILKIERELKGNIKICVSSTQLIEAGVDFDFPCIFREIGPLESIIQSAGRCNREWKSVSGNVYIFRLAGAKFPDKLYKSMAETAIDLISDDIEILHDHDFFSEYYRKVIKLFVDPDKNKINEAREKFNFETVAQCYRIIDKANESLFIRNYNEQSQELCRSIENKGFITRDDYRLIQEYSVQVFTNFLINNKDLFTQPVPNFKIWEGGYDLDTGITSDPLTAEDTVI